MSMADVTTRTALVLHLELYSRGSSSSEAVWLPLSFERMSLRSAFLSSLTSPCFLRGGQPLCPGVRAVGLLSVPVHDRCVCEQQPRRRRRCALL